jgi:tRNA dimethylallyltransferase
MSTKSLSISSIFERKTAPNTVLVISGATSVGKSSVALDLCQLIGGEIISSDSVQVYSQLDVGSNKATAAEMALVPHHLIDIAEPSTTLTTGDFSRRAAAAIDDILSRGKVPVLVGGATMWIQWLVQGIPDAPKAKPKAQQRASELLKDIEPARRWDDAMALLEQYDPARAAKLSRNDWYRMRRSLEIAVQIVEFDNVASSRPPSPAGSPLLDGKRKSVLGSREVDLRTVFINEDRSLLYHTIDSRCVDMLRLGHISEVGDLLYREVLRPEYPVSKAIGYRQTIEYLARGADHSGAGPSAMRKIYLEEDMVAFLEYLK